MPIEVKVRRWGGPGPVDIELEPFEGPRRVLREQHPDIDVALRVRGAAGDAAEEVDGHGVAGLVREEAADVLCDALRVHSPILTDHDVHRRSDPRGPDSIHSRIVVPRPVEAVSRAIAVEELAGNLFTRSPLGRCAGGARRQGR
jgi:hypothetical protein